MSWLIKGGNIMHELTKLIKDDMRPALGVTEPGAIAYAVSKARSYLTGELKEVRLLDVYKRQGFFRFHGNRQW